MEQIVITTNRTYLWSLEILCVTVNKVGGDRKTFKVMTSI